MKTGIKRVRKHYILLYKQDNRVYICYHKQQIADIIGVNVKTIARHLTNVPLYDTEEYCIWKDVVILKRSKG